jgi:Transposase DDE domain/Insertion element 4 transposase N-terminal
MNITRTRFVNHCQDIRKDLLSLPTDSQELPLAAVLGGDLIQSAMDELGLKYRDRIFSPCVTIWLFVTQILSADQSCQNVINRFISWLSSRKRKLCSTATGGYSQARQRLPIEFIKVLVFRMVLRLQAQTIPQGDWTFHQRPVKLVDGTTVTMPDTQENREKYPKRKNTYGFPMMRLVALISFSTGGLMDLEMGPYVGKGTGETSLFLKLFQNSKAIQEGDILVMDRLYCTHLILALCMMRNVDVVVRLAGAMKSEKFKTVSRFGKGDRLVELQQCRQSKDTPQDPKLLESIPEILILREITYHLAIPGFRAKTITILTTFLDAKSYKKEEIVEIYYQRWNCELDLRNIKSILNMDQLNCKTPEMIEKEIWMFVLAYNVIRTVMAQSAILYKLKPRDLSFKGTLQAINNFRPVLELSRNHEQWESQYKVMLQVISQQKLIKRPGRIEPRALKRRSIPYMQLKVPRAQARKLYWKRGDITIKRNKDLAAST